jgi:hypothetical protein
VVHFWGVCLVLVNDKEEKKLKFSQLKSLSGGYFVSGEMKNKQKK